MSGPTLAEQLAAFLSAKDRISDAIQALEAISPDVLKGPEEALRQAIVTAVQPLDVPTLLESLDAARKVIQEGKGVVGGGFDANLA